MDPTEPGSDNTPSLQPILRDPNLPSCPKRKNRRVKFSVFDQQPPRLLLCGLLELKESKLAIMRGLDQFCTRLTAADIEELLYEKQAVHVVMRSSAVLADFTQRSSQFFLAGKSERFCDVQVSLVEEQTQFYTAHFVA